MCYILSHIFLFLINFFSFQLEEHLFSMSCKLGLMVLTSFSFCLSLKAVVSPSSLKKLCQIKHSWLTVFIFQQQCISLHSLLAHLEFLLRNLLIAYWEFPSMLPWSLCFLPCLPLRFFLCHLFLTVSLCV